MGFVRFLCICCLLGAPAVAADPAVSTNPGKEIEFHFKATPGEVTRTRLTAQTSGSMTMLKPLPPQKLSQTFEQETVMKCLRADPGKPLVFEMSIPNVAITMNMGGIDLTVDTRKPATSSQPVFGMINRVFDKITKVTCTVTFSPKGEVIKVEGLSEGIKGVLEEAKTVLPLAMRKMLDQMRDYLGDQLIEENLRGNYRLIPDGGKARVGDKWVREWQMNMPPFNISTKARGEYELLGVEQFRGRPCAKISAKTIMNDQTGTKPAGSASEGVPRGLADRVRFRLHASGGNGIAYVDYTTGQLVQFREMQRTTIEISIDPDANAPADGIKEGMGRMTQSLTTAVNIEMLDGQSESATATQPAAESRPARP